jgi:hypothetical protein
MHCIFPELRLQNFFFPQHFLPGFEPPTSLSVVDCSTIVLAHMSINDSTLAKVG